MSKSKKLKFLRDAIYDGKIVHKAGEEKDVDNSLGHADRWVKRGVALDIVAGEESAQKAKEAEEKKKQAKLEKAKLEQDRKAAKNKKDEPVQSEEKIDL